MVSVLCWLVIHSSHDAGDNREYKPYKGTVMHSGTQYLMVNFYDDFKKKKVDLENNSTSQLVEENECLYE